MEDVLNKNELVYIVNDKFFWLMKFGSRKNIEMLQQGKIYMKNLQYYINLEHDSDDEDVGDIYDGLLPIHDVNLKIYTVDTKEFITQIKTPVSILNLGYKKAPVFCMFILDSRNNTDVSLFGDELTARYDFSDKQKLKLSVFGDSVLMITDPGEFFSRMSKGLNDAGIGFARDKVKYYERNTKEHFEDVMNNNSRIGFWKRKKYDYQQEYRYILDSSIDDYIIIDVGNLSDISRIESADKIINSFTEVKFFIDKK